MEQLKELLFQLCGAVGTPGDEQFAAQCAKKALEPYCTDVTIDHMGNVIGFMGDKNAERQVMLDAHIDQIGMIVTQIDEDGFLFFKGRYKRMFTHGGFKLYPSYIEGIIVSHPKVENCCVISIPDQTYGFSPEAHVVIKKDSVSQLKKLKEELIKLCQDKLPEYSQPEDFIFEEDLPLTSVGKVDYKKVEKMRIKKLEESTK